MKRRQLIRAVGGLALLPLLPGRIIATEEKPMEQEVERLELSEQEWRERLTREQFHVLREEGTEPEGSSELLHEKRKGIYHCVACDHPLFSSETKFDSGTGWPSFYDALPNAFETKLDFSLIWPRTEYHCKRCGGHHGHIFEDGPEPTGLRYCNNGVALKFVPDEA